MSAAAVRTISAAVRKNLPAGAARLFMPLCLQKSAFHVKDTPITRSKYRTNPGKLQPSIDNRHILH
jgi:hypothetical protein